MTLSSLAFKLRTKNVKQSRFQVTYKNVKNFKSCEFIIKFIQTMIKTVFLFHYLNELLTS